MRLEFEEVVLDLLERIVLKDPHVSYKDGLLVNVDCLHHSIGRKQLEIGFWA